MRRSNNSTMQIESKTEREREKCGSVGRMGGWGVGIEREREREKEEETKSFEVD